MTTIILVALGVLIAAAAALALIFYGGEAFAVNKIRAEAVRLVGEGAQVQYATDLFYRERGVMPAVGPNGEDPTVELVAEKYLQSVPQGVVNADGTAERWKMVYSTDGMIYSRLGDKTDAHSLAVCREARRQLQYTDRDANGDIAIYKCDGTDYRDVRWRTSGTLPDREPCCIR